MRELFKKGLKELGIQPDDCTLDLFFEYMSLIKSWNDKINITAITDDKEIIIKHFLDSLSSIPFLKLENKRVLDMGTGAGFPGLPIKLIVPELDITFIDSSHKKMMVLEDICKKLGIQGYKVVAGNIENLGHDINHREMYDYVFCRALSSLSVLIEYGVPLLKENGMMVIYKGHDILEEVENSSRALNELQAKILEKHEIALPFSDFKRSILIVEKIWKTNGKYPRKPGIPRKKPL